MAGGDLDERDGIVVGGRVAGKIALVTGAASGIGKATAERLSAEGATVLLADYNIDGASNVADALTTSGASAQAFHYDANDAASCRRMVTEAAAAHQGIDILCNIAGIMDWGPVEAFSEAQWERMLRINLSSLFYVTQQALPHLIRARGVVVNMASAAALMGVAYTSAYSAAKAGVIAMTKSMAMEFAQEGVRLNCIAPGGVITPMHHNTQIPPGLDLKRIERVAPRLGQLCEPNEIAGAVLFLASDDAKNMTGTVMVIDGGQTAG